MRARLSVAIALAGLFVFGCASVRSVDRDEPLYAHGAVAADHALASQAGLEMLSQGGNAVDAAVAASFCLSVVRPYSCGIGGGGFMLVYAPRERADDGAPLSVAIDYRETCPAAIGIESYGERGGTSASRFGPHACAVPGTVAGLAHALEQYGTLDLSTVLAPAIRAAEEGFAADADWVAAVAEMRERLDANPERVEGARYVWDVLCRGGEVEIGTHLDNRDQAEALRLIARDGPDAFYRGAIAGAIGRAMREARGPMTLRDLATYRVSTRAPLRGSFGEYDVLTMPPPSSGGVAMLEILGILERLGFDERPPRSRARFVHLVTEATKHAFADRAEWLGDPAYVDVPVERLLSSEYLDALAAKIEVERTLDAFDYGSVSDARVAALEDGGTSHVSVIDANGMAVACTETINLVFGSMVAVPEYGFVLNDEMDDFTTQPGVPNAFGLRQSDRNAPAPGKRPLSSMSPTIVLESGRARGGSSPPRVRAVAGASGGPKIITATLEVLLASLLDDRPPGAAVAAPRFHHQWMPHVLLFEEAWTDEKTIRAVESYGHATGRTPTIGYVQIVIAEDGGIRAASDPRKGGVAAGY